MRFYTQFGLTLSCLSVGLQAQTPDVATNAVTGDSPFVSTNQATRPLSLPEAIQMAVEHNYTIAIARYEPAISQYQLSGSYSYYEPKLNFSATHNYNESEASLFAGGAIAIPGTKATTESFGPSVTGVAPWGLSYTLSGTSTRTFGDRGLTPFDEYSSDAGISLRQPLLKDFWINQGRLSIQLAKKDLKISEYDLLYQVMQIINRVQQSYYNLIAAQDLVRARQVALDLARRLVQENRQRVRVGTMAPLDEKQAESQAAQSEADLIQAQANVIVYENILKNLITDNFESMYAVGIQPTDKLIAVPQGLDLQDSWLKGLALRPDFNQLKMQLERQGLVVKYDFNQLFPSLDLVGSYGRKGSDVLGAGNDASFSGSLADLRDETAPRYSYGAVISMPLTLRSERNRYKADKAVQKQRELQVKQLHQDIMVNIQTAVKTAQADYQSVQATRAAREYAQIALDAEQKKYDNGKSTPFVLLRLQRDLTDARAAEISALAKYNIDLSNLAFQEGTILDKNRVSIQFK